MQPQIKIYLLPGGHIPERQTDGAIGYDVYLRAIVSAAEIDSSNPNLRRTLFDFKNLPEDALIARHVKEINNKLVYQMDSGESVLVGIGFVTEMPYPLFYWVAPRSGLASKWGITVTNAPGTVDPDYRGEAGVLVYNRNSTSFNLAHNMRIAQIIFQWAVIPDVIQAMAYEDLEGTYRGAGGFGSTGIE